MPDDMQWSDWTIAKQWVRTPRRRRRVGKPRTVDAGDLDLVHGPLVVGARERDLLSVLAAQRKRWARRWTRLSVLDDAMRESQGGKRCRSRGSKRLCVGS